MTTAKQLTQACSTKPGRHYSTVDRFIIESNRILRTLGQPSDGQTIEDSRVEPAGVEGTRVQSTGVESTGVESTGVESTGDEALSSEQRQHSAGLMRINHTGEVCAQALYRGQALTAKLAAVRETMEQAAAEEEQHLNWCHQRLRQLGEKPSVLNPLFYGTSFGMGALAGAISDKTSLGFIAATEELVCQHLAKHLTELPEADKKSRAIVTRMLADEARHRQSALDAGGTPFPSAVKVGMKLLSRVMTATTYKF